MQQLVRVRQTFEDGTATVIHIRESACSGDCHKCSGCGAAKEAILLDAKNPIGAKVGDLVTIESKTGPVLKASTGPSPMQDHADAPSAPDGPVEA